MNRTIRPKRTPTLGMETLDDRILPSPVVTGLARRARRPAFFRSNSPRGGNFLPNRALRDTLRVAPAARVNPTFVASANPGIARVGPVGTTSLHYGGGILPTGEAFVVRETPGATVAASPAEGPEAAAAPTQGPVGTTNLHYGGGILPTGEAYLVR